MHQADLVIGRFVRHGTEEQKKKYLPGLCNGTRIGCLAITPNPHGDRTAMSMQTRAERTDTGWAITGTKTFITNAPVADFALVYTRTGGRESRDIGLFRDRGRHRGVHEGSGISRRWDGEDLRRANSHSTNVRFRPTNCLDPQTKEERF